MSQEKSKTILGLDLGTNSIGWALVKQEFENKTGEILGMGSRIIPMSQDILGEFGKGNSVSQTAERTRYRSMRRLRERHLLRRERLHRVLNIIGFLPEHFAAQIDFEKHLGKFLNGSEPKLAYKTIPNSSLGNADYEFVFKGSFEEMLADFQEHGKSGAVPYDWTIYYLRKKALSRKIEREELAWLILHFNQKRGYFQSRGIGDEFDDDDASEVLSLKVINVIRGEKDKKYNKYWYTIDLEGGYNYQSSFYGDISNWIGTTRDFVIAREILKDGTTKFRISSLPTLDEIDKLDKKAQNKLYGKIKIKTENEVEKSGKTVGAFIYDTLIQRPQQKIRGKLIRTIERKFYRDELKLILKKQKEFHPELNDENKYHECIQELYEHNEAHQRELGKRDFVHLFLDDIIFYQRPLRSQKSNVGTCSLEFRKYKDENGMEHTQYLRATPKSNPLYQEFRLWQWLHNLSIYRKDDDVNVTKEFIGDNDEWVRLFDFINNRKDVEQKDLLKFLLGRKGLKGKALNSEVDKYRWNYVEDKIYPCNETRWLINSRFEKVANITVEFVTREMEQHLWHIIYSVNNVSDYEQALKKFALKHKIDAESFVGAFKKFPPRKSEYGAYSEKAIKKLLSLMRLGKYWSWDVIDGPTRGRIDKIITGEFDSTIKDRVREKAIRLTNESHFQGLQMWLAQYIVYGRHSEASVAGKWNSVDDLEKYLNEFKQHSLRNPIVEQVIAETLRMVRDIWARFGNGKKDFFKEIHVELGREMKNNSEERERITEQINRNENTNLRIKVLLAEMSTYAEMTNVRAYSPVQQEILKIFEEGVLKSGIEIDDEILKISKTAQPKSAELRKYKLWLEQKYRSPYTGEIIPLNKLFTPEYEIEHVIPQSRYFDDGFNNKVICEAAVNKLKDNQLAFEFIKNHQGEKVELGLGRSVQVFKSEAYKDFINKHYSGNRGKHTKLLLEDIPEKMVERQMNDTRYVSKYISELLSNIVRAETNDDGINSKNLIPCNGKITSELKQDWGLNDVWNELILPRFERLNSLTHSTHFTVWNEKHQKFLPTVPLKDSKGFSKKRIDHRHHAMDALVIACATRDHINLLNNKHAKSKERFDLNRKLRAFERIQYNHPHTGERIEREVPRDFFKPWASFTIDAKNALDNIVVSFKQNLRVINKATNHYQKWVSKDGLMVKELVEQKGVNWAIRKQLHKDTVAGKVELTRVKVPKGKILTATRKPIDVTFDLNTIDSITDSGIQKILRNYLASKDNNPESAFSPEGIDELNKNIARYNDGKPHQSIYKARIFETGNKFQVGQTGNKNKKYVEAAKGTNLFFAIYQDTVGKRNFDSIPFNNVVERQKQGLASVPEKNNQGNDLLFHLSPNDLVYIPTDDELVISNSGIHQISKHQGRIYRFVSCTGGEGHFVANSYATGIINNEQGTNNKSERMLDFKHLPAIKDDKGKPQMIKTVCIKIIVDRIGNIRLA